MNIKKLLSTTPIIISTAFIVSIFTSGSYASAINPYTLQTTNTQFIAAKKKKSRKRTMRKPKSIAYPEIKIFILSAK